MDSDWRAYLDEVDNDLFTEDDYELNFIDTMLKNSNNPNYQPSQKQLDFLMSLYERLT